MLKTWFQAGRANHWEVSAVTSWVNDLLMGLSLTGLLRGGGNCGSSHLIGRSGSLVGKPWKVVPFLLPPSLFFSILATPRQATSFSTYFLWQSTQPHHRLTAIEAAKQGLNLCNWNLRDSKTMTSFYSKMFRYCVRMTNSYLTHCTLKVKLCIPFLSPVRGSL